MRRGSGIYICLLNDLKKWLLFGLFGCLAFHTLCETIVVGLWRFLFMRFGCFVWLFLYFRVLEFLPVGMFYCS